MQIRCPDCRQSIEPGEEDVFSDVRCTTCGTVFTLIGDETLEFRTPALHQVDHFQLQERIGWGTFGSVWKAYDTDLDRTVAIKLPRRGELNGREAEQFLREARAAANLRHPNIVAVHEVGHDQDAVYMVMDYVNGPTLADRIGEGRVTPREAAQLFVKIAEAVHYAHEAGVIHRDLKPANVLLDANGEPHITDFGLAKQTAEDVTLSLDGRILGTPAYMSPEQAQGETSRIDRRSDVYSLGVMLFELLTGERPFRGNLRMLLTHVVQSEVPRPRELNSHIPQDLETICLKCLEKDPRRRYATASALAEDLRRYLEAKPILARPTPAWTRVQRWCRRNMLATSLACGLIVVLLAGLIATATQWARAEKTAARETELRREVELLTRELLQLVEQIRTEDAAPPAGSRASLARFEAARELSFDYKQEDAPVLEGAPPPAPTRGAGELRVPQASALSTGDLELGAKASSSSTRDAKRVSQASRLRAQAQEKLRALEPLAPAIAAEYRKLLDAD